MTKVLKSSRSELAVGALLLLLAISVYLLTLAPSVSFRDSGDMVSASYTLGVSHPSGFPLYMLTGKAFSAIPLGEIGARYSLFSLLSGALSVLFVFLVVLRLTGVPQGALFSALLLAFALSFWTYSSMSEKYPLYAFFSALLVFTATVRGKKGLYLIAFFFGLGLTHHLALVVFFLPCLALLYFRAGKNYFTAKDYFLAALAGFLPLLLYAYLPLRAGAGGPLTWGGPMDLQRFLAHITAKEYRYAMFSGSLLDLPLRFYRQVIVTFASELTPVGLFLSACGALLLFRRDRQFALFLLLAFLSNVLIFVNYNILDPQNIVTYYFASFIILAVWAGIAVTELHEQGKTVHPWLKGLTVVALLFVVFYWLLAGNFNKADRSNDRQLSDYGANLLKSVDKGSVLLANGDVPLFSVWYQQYVNGRNKAVYVIPSLNIDMEKTIEKNFPRQNVYLNYYPYGAAGFKKYGLLPAGPVFKVYSKEVKEVSVDVSAIKALWKSCGGEKRAEPDAIITKLYAQARFEQGEFFLEHGYFSEAEEQYDECLKLLPNYVFAWISLGELAEKAGKKPLSLKYYNHALLAAGVAEKLPPAADIAAAKAGLAGLLEETARVRAARGAEDLASYYNTKRERLIKWR